MKVSDRPLRVAVVWNESILAEDLYEPTEDISLQQLYALPADVEQDVPLFRPHGPAFALVPNAAIGGEVWIGGKRTAVSQLAAPTPIGPEDYGVLTVGPLAVFFQHVKGAKAPPRALIQFDWSLVACVLLSTFLCGTLLVIGYLDWVWNGRGEHDRHELDAELVTRFMVTPPPEDLLEDTESGTETEDPGLRAREETGGERAEDDEGRVGNENAEQEDTEIEGAPAEAVATKVRTMGLLGALDGGGEGNAIAAALDVPSISDILGGTGAVSTTVGRGSRGAGLRGSGMGGGGTGPGALFGAGDVGTGIGSGMGGTGMGMGGIGTMGRMNAERVVSVMRGRPRVSGYLSAEQINRVVRANQTAVRYCYEVEVQRQPNLRGRVSIAWRINRQGTVASARVASSSLNNDRVEGCIVRQVRRWRFPEPDGGEVSVEYPFIFGVQGG